MQNEVIDPNKPVFDGTPTWMPRLLDPHNESHSFLDDAAIARLKEIEAIKDDKEKGLQRKLFILRQASFLPTAPMHYSFFDNVSKLVNLLGLEKREEIVFGGASEDWGKEEK